MTKDELWEVYTRKNPQFLKKGANLTPAGLKKFFNQTYSVAYKEGLKKGAEKNPVSELGNIFGMHF